MKGSSYLNTSKPASAKTPQERIEDENFDISILGRIDADLLLLFSRPQVNDENLQTLVRLIFQGSQMYLSRLEDEPLPENIAHISSGINGVVTADVPDTYGLGTDNSLLSGREDFSLSCLSMLFSLCSDNSKYKDDGDESKARRRLAKMVSPFLLERTQSVIRNYTRDRPVFGKCPLPRIRNEEILFILDNLEKLHLIEAILDISKAKRESCLI
jgi:hypothetical protein